MKNNQRGITLIALIITIVILLILAVVTITSVKDEKLIEKTEEATDAHEIAKEKEKIQLELNEWLIQKYLYQQEGFENFLKDKYGESNVQPTTPEGSFIITTPNENQFIVTEDGATHIEEVKDGKFIKLNQTILTGNVYMGSIEIGQLTATTNIDASELVWTVPEDSGITLTGEGNTKAVTISAQGEFKITVSYRQDSSIKAECNVIATYSKPGTIKFYIDGKEHFAITGATWKYWIEELGGKEKYGYIVIDNKIFTSSGVRCVAGVNSTDIIKQDKSYYTE